MAHDEARCDMSNYPDTTGPNDPTAPWNQKDLPEFEPKTFAACVECDRGLDDLVEVDVEFICRVCFERHQDEG